MAQHQETQLGSTLLAHDDDMASDDFDNLHNPPVFDGFSSSFQLNSSNNSVMVNREEAVGVGVDVVSAAGMRSCSECGKQFSSGKALGGHKRACLQTKKLKLKPTIKIEVAVAEELGAGSGNKSSNVDQGGGGGVGCRCCVCDQSFTTLKSLYGHMRKHPDRHWRGIHPPQQPLNHHRHLSASSTISNHRNDDDDGENKNDKDEVAVAVAMDLVGSLKGWSVKDKRGKKSSASADTTRLSKEEEEADPVDKEGASNLFFLAQTLQNYDFGGQSKKRKFDEVDRASGYGALKIKERRPETDHDQENDKENKRKMKQQKKKRKLTELEPNTYRFHCPICNKGFDKHQALGGHVASHNNNKNKNLDNSMKESSDSVEEERQAEAEAAAEAEEESDDQENSGDDDRSSRVNSELGELHQCNVCSKNFPTGQALGGHKRCHWTGHNFPEAFSSSSQVTTSTGEVSQTPPRRVVGGLDVDLNDTPQEFYKFFGFPDPGEEAGAGSKDS